MTRALWPDRKSSPPARWRPLLAAVVAVLAVVGVGVGAWSVLAAAQPEPLAPAVSTIAPTTAAAPVVAPPPTSPAPENDPAPTTRRTTERSTARTPPSWSPDQAAEAERRLRELQSDGPNSPLRKCLESGKLYEQCTG